MASMKRALCDYFSDPQAFPASLMFRFLRPRGSASRRFFLQRPPGAVTKHYKHDGMPTTAQALALLMIHESEHDPNRCSLVVDEKLLLDSPWFELHLGWLSAAPIPLSPPSIGIPLVPSLRQVTFEIVFDIDLPDYEKKRGDAFPLRRGFLCHCASAALAPGGAEPKKGCCRHCWLLVRLTRVALEHMLAPWSPTWGPALWVFSGGKGAHCIYGSATARNVTLVERDTLTAHFNSFCENATAVHDHMSYWRPIVDAVLQAWVTMGVNELQILARDSACRLLAEYCLEPGQRETFEKALGRLTTSAERWRFFATLVTPKALLTFLWCIGLPPIDSGPFTGHNKSIKASFSVHKATHCIAVPLSDAAFSQFDPERSVTLGTPQPRLREALRGPHVVLEQWLDANGY